MKPSPLESLRSIARKDGYVAALVSFFEYVVTRSALLRSLFFRSYERREEDERFDDLHGTDTDGVIHSVELGFSTRDHHGYMPMPKVAFDWAIAHCGIPAERLSSFVFVDLGSGKGRALLRAAAHPFKRIVGVELAEQLFRISERNAEIYRAKNPATPPFELVLGDAAEYQYPDENLLVLLLNSSFGKSVLERVLERLADAARQHGREAVVAIAVPERIAVLEGRPEWVLRAESEDGQRKIFAYVVTPRP